MAKAVKFGVILSGSGVFDGAEIHESVLTLLAITRHGGSYVCYAPDIAQAHVVNHLTGSVAEGETRNVLVESARIARGKVTALSAFRPEDVDALIFPGGFGAAKNLSSFAFDGAAFNVNPEVAAAIKGTMAAKKPVAALCIAPAILAKVVGDQVQLTIGNDAGTAEALEKVGAKHVVKGHAEVVVDRAHRVVTTPCYMLDATVAQIADGADAAVKAVIELIG